MLRIGITGNIASGKSEVEKVIKKRGYKVFDLDEVVHCIYDSDLKVKEQLIAEFGTFDRKAIGKVVFVDLNKKKKLESIIYPVLKKNIMDIFDKNLNEKFLFVSGALLYESGFSEFFDKVIFVDAKEEIRLKRLMKRNNFSLSEAKSRIKLQNTKNIDKADYIIVNNEKIENLEPACNSIIEELHKLSGEDNGI